MAIPPFPQNPVVLVDDEADVLDALQIGLRKGGITNMIALQSGKDLLSLLPTQRVEVILLDLGLRDVPGEQVLENISRDYPAIPIIIVTGRNELDTVVKCMRSGAIDYLVKPVERARMLASVKQALEIRTLKRAVDSLRESLFSRSVKNPDAFRKIVTKNDRMHSNFQYLEMVSPTSQPVMILGETGVGKELLARCIHDLSGRHGKFVTINVAGLDDTFFSDSLFGHERGAFTGADRARKGLIEQAAGGTLFLDEIGDLETASQVKLLRVLQEGEYYPLGADQPKHTNARVVVATNRDLVALQNSGQFRNDLYYRLNTHCLEIPPLRERLEDVPLLVDHYLTRAAENLGIRKPSVPDSLITLLSTYTFPGNVRELEGMVLDAMAQHKGGSLSMASFRRVMQRQLQLQSGPKGDFGDVAKPESDVMLQIKKDSPLPLLRELERKLIEEAMRRAKGNQTIASEMLGMARQTLQMRLKQYSVVSHPADIPN